MSTFIDVQFPTPKSLTDHLNNDDKIKLWESEIYNFISRIDLDGACVLNEKSSQIIGVVISLFNDFSLGIKPFPDGFTYTVLYRNGKPVTTEMFGYTPFNSPRFLCMVDLVIEIRRMANLSTLDIFMNSIKNFSLKF